MVYVWYVGAVMIVSLVLFIGLGIAALIIAKVGERYGLWKQEGLELVNILLGILAIFLVGPLSVLLLGWQFQYYPPGLGLKDNIISSTPTEIDQELEALEQTAVRLKKAFSDPKKLTLAEVEQLVIETLNFSTSLSEKTRKQQEVIQSLRTSVEAEQKNAEDSRRLAEKIRSITREQLEAIKFVITQDAREQSNRAFFYGAVASFPIGVIASIIASFLYQRFLKQPRRKPGRRIPRRNA